MFTESDSDEELLACVANSLEEQYCEITQFPVKKPQETNALIVNIKKELEENINCPIQTQAQAVEDVPIKYLECLQREFGHSDFRQAQWNIIRSILEEEFDNVAIVATGYGKSLTYQFPAIYLNKVSLVVSPLISLMEDQVRALNLTRERACLLGTAQLDKNIETRIRNFDFNVIYSTPEHITGEIGLRLLRDLGDNLVLIAVDEAHCISQWGHDFRPTYRKLSVLRKTVPKPPILALTATATQQVCDDICQQLMLRQPQLIKSGFDRPNLQFIVRSKSQSIWNDMNQFVRWAIDRQQGSVIIYCNTRNNTELVANELRQHMPCHYYHSKLEPTLKKLWQEEFANDDVRIMVATMAFGMGIDKPDVRLVIHYGAPSDMERYYQEVGRAGRDGLSSMCVLFYSNADWSVHQHFRNSSNIESSRMQHLENSTFKIAAYTKIMTCRRKYILEYFDDIEAASELQNHSDCCDNCFARMHKKDFNQINDGVDENGMIDITTDASLILKLLYDLQERYGVGKIIMILRGSRSKLLPANYRTHNSYGKGAAKSEAWYKLVIENLKTQNYIYAKAHIMGFGMVDLLGITEKGIQWLDCMPKTRASIQIEATDDVLKLHKPKMQNNNNWIKNEMLSIAVKTSNSQEKCVIDDELWKALIRQRSKLATELGVKPYVIATNIALKQLATMKPTDIDHLKNCKLNGFYDLKYERFGSLFLNCIRDNLTAAEPNFEKQQVNGAKIKEESLPQCHNFKMESDIKSEPLTPQKRPIIKVEPNTWETESDSNDAYLSQKGEEIELDLLLADIAREENQIFQDSCNTSSTSAMRNDNSSYLMVRPRKNYGFKYIDTDDSDDDSKLKPQSKAPVIQASVENAPNVRTTPSKVRILPSWMLNNTR